MTKIFPQLTSPDAADKIAQLLWSKASTPRPLNLPELLRKLKPSISKMLRNGHTYSDVVQVLAEHDVATTESVVEAYQTGVALVKGSKGKGKDKERSAEAEIQIDAQKAEAILKAFEKQASLRKGLTKEELVEQLKEPIEKMLAAHYTYQDISAVMAEGGVLISPATLKSYYQGKKRQESQEKTEKDIEKAEGIESLGVASKRSKTSLNKEINSELDLVTDSKMPELKAPTLKESQSSSVGSKRLPELGRDSEGDLEKEFDL